MREGRVVGMRRRGRAMRRHLKKRHENIREKSKQKNKVLFFVFEMKGNETKQNFTKNVSTLNKDQIYRK